jgi:hypothetical protein
MLHLLQNSVMLLSILYSCKHENTQNGYDAISIGTKKGGGGKHGYEA